VGSEHDSQCIRLLSRKCTIGSGEGCTLRLRAQGIRAIECLIVRGKGGTLLRAGSGDVKLNGQTVDDALLAPGDRLSVGPIDLEVVSLDAAETEPSCTEREIHRPSRGSLPNGRKAEMSC
jgi:hypothetical protein